MKLIMSGLLNIIFFHKYDDYKLGKLNYSTNFAK